MHHKLECITNWNASQYQEPSENEITNSYKCVCTHTTMHITAHMTTQYTPGTTTSISKKNYRMHHLNRRKNHQERKNPFTLEHVSSKQTNQHVPIRVGEDRVLRHGAIARVNVPCKPRLAMRGSSPHHGEEALEESDFPLRGFSQGDRIPSTGAVDRESPIHPHSQD